MAERFVQIGISPQVNLEYQREKAKNPDISKYILDCDIDTAAQTLIDEGLLQEWDCLTVAFEPDSRIDTESSPGWANVYNAFTSPEGEIIATNLVHRLRLIADFDRNN
jgi:hypothetical protein